MPTEKEIEAAAEAIYEALCPTIDGVDGEWHPDFRDSLSGRDAYIFAATKAFEAAEMVQNENLAVVSENIRQANAFAIAQWPCSNTTDEMIKNEKT